MLLYRIIIIFVLLFNNINIDNMDNNILFEMTQAQEIIIYTGSNTTQYSNTSVEFEQICSILKDLSVSSREMPAFGVALHNETIEAIKDGIWIEFIFDETKSHNDMPFDSLLINIVGDYTGFNIIRKYQGKYDGRCFYVDLIDNNMTTIEKYIKSLK